MSEGIPELIPELSWWPGEVQLVLPPRVTAGKVNTVCPVTDSRARGELREESEDEEPYWSWIGG